MDDEILRALLKTIEGAGMKHKALYVDLDIDAGHWARLIKGEAHFPLEKLKRLFEICGNKILLEVLAKQNDCLLIPAAEADRLKEMESKYRHAVEFFRDTQK